MESIYEVIVNFIIDKQTLVLRLIFTGKDSKSIWKRFPNSCLINPTCLAKLLLLIQVELRGGFSQVKNQSLYFVKNYRLIRLLLNQILIRVYITAIPLVMF